MAMYADVAEALEAVGLSEWPMSQEIAVWGAWDLDTEASTDGRRQEWQGQRFKMRTCVYCWTGSKERGFRTPTTWIASRLL
jgi:hypothetical protein